MSGTGDAVFLLMHRDAVDDEHLAHLLGFQNHDFLKLGANLVQDFLYLHVKTTSVTEFDAVVEPQFHELVLLDVKA